MLQAIAWMTASNPYKALHGSPTAASVRKVTDDFIPSDETRGIINMLLHTLQSLMCCGAYVVEN